MEYLNAGKFDQLGSSVGMYADIAAIFEQVYVE